jgi:hypothetical protein
VSRQRIISRRDACKAKFECREEAGGIGLDMLEKYEPRKVGFAT